jgi:hypothetical protein
VGTAGYCAAHLKQFDAARKAFRICADLSVELLELQPAPWQFRSTLEMALLAGARGIEEQVLRFGVDLVHKDFALLGTVYLRLLCSLIQSDLQSAQTAALEAIQLDETATKWKLHRGLGQLGLSISERDDSSLTAAVTTVLDSHVRMATRGPLKGLDAGLLCVPAVCLGVAARRIGLQLTIPANFHSVMLPRVVGVLETWNRTPVQRQPFETVADIFPDTLSITS